MFQHMLNGSRAVLLRPAVATFEEYERNDLGWAVIYIAIVGAITAVLNTIAFTIRGPAMREAMRGLEDQLGGQPLPPGFDTLIRSKNPLTVDFHFPYLTIAESQYILVSTKYCMGHFLSYAFISATNEESMTEARECARLLLETIPNLMRALHGSLRQCKSGDEEHLNMGQFRMLAMLHESSRSLGELAASHHVTPSTMSRTIDVLVRKAWVARETDPSDRRQVILTLTDDGRAALTAMGQHTEEMVTSMLAQLDDQERARLYDGLMVLRKLLTSDE